MKEKVQNWLLSINETHSQKVVNLIIFLASLYPLYMLCKIGFQDDSYFYSDIVFIIKPIFIKRNMIVFSTIFWLIEAMINLLDTW